LVAGTFRDGGIKLLEMNVSLANHVAPGVVI
jgi:hypothetical protein